MLMPEAPMNEEDLSLGREDNIWATWEVSSMQTITIAEGINEFPDHHLWLCVG